MSGMRTPFTFATIIFLALPTAVPGPGASAASAPSGTARTSPVPGASGDAAVRWMPAGTQLLIRVRFSEMRTSSLFRSLMTSKPLFAAEMAPTERFAAEAGLDLARDLDLGWIGTDGRAGGASVSALSGRLDGAALGARLEKRGARVGSYADLPLYTLAGKPGPRGTPAETVIAFPRPGMALVGSRSWVSLAIDRAQGRGGETASALQPLAGRADGGATIWSAASGAAVSEKVRTEWSSGQLGGEDFEGVRSLVTTFRIAGDLAIDSEAKAADEDAETLALTLKGLIAVSGLRASVSDPSLADVLKGTRVDRTDGGVRVTARIPASLCSRL